MAYGQWSEPKGQRIWSSASATVKESYEVSSINYTTFCTKNIKGIRVCFRRGGTKATDLFELIVIAVLALPFGDHAGGEILAELHFQEIFQSSALARAPRCRYARSISKCTIEII